jgi:hypothetical protein
MRSAVHALPKASLCLLRLQQNQMWAVQVYLQALLAFGSSRPLVCLAAAPVAGPYCRRDRQAPKFVLLEEIRVGPLNTLDTHPGCLPLEPKRPAGALLTCATPPARCLLWSLQWRRTGYWFRFGVAGGSAVTTVRRGGVCRAAGEQRAAHPLPLL